MPGNPALSVGVFFTRALSITLRANKLGSLRIEGACTLLLLTCSALLYGTHWWVLAILYLLRALILTVLDSFAHYQTPLNDPLFGRNVKVPIFFERVCLLNFNYHGAHHIFPTVPWDKSHNKCRASIPISA